MKIQPRVPLRQGPQEAQGPCIIIPAAGMPGSLPMYDHTKYQEVDRTYFPAGMGNLILNNCFRIP